eukprot:TRINITY_DN4843_c0_g1_i3.p2 TRINITY_DN4843_c0_g1~~TRINITY_DN4843_c0_g1_i3.p2  ORF type:complete len:120 (-),score=19.84 TRINITY_DN4843_c0_g1_i3:336-695(-)
MVEGNYCAKTCGFCESIQQEQQTNKINAVTQTRDESRVASTPTSTPASPDSTPTPKPPLPSVTPTPSTQTSSTPTVTSPPSGNALSGLLSQFNDLIQMQTTQNNDESSVVQKRAVGNDV